jgi:hypothetical protein
LVWGAACAVCAFGACGGSAFTAGTGDGGTDASSSSGSGSGSGGSSSGGDGSGSSSGADGSSSGSPTHWCSSQTAFFCEDFDEESDVPPFLASWSSYAQTNGSFHFDKLGVPSPPNALDVFGSNNADVLVVKSFPALPSRPTQLRLAFELRINSAGSVGALSAAGFAAIAYGPNISDGFAALAIGNGPMLSAAWVAPGDAGASDAGAYAIENSTNPFPALNVWSGRYAIEIDYNTIDVTACAQVYQGPTALLAHCLVLPPSLSDPKVVSIALGDYSAGLGNTGSVDMAFDNVTFDVAY